jgi:hypothetical protein
MKTLIVEKQLNHRKQKLQEQQQQLVLEDISPIWASDKKSTNFYVIDLVGMAI